MRRSSRPKPCRCQGPRGVNVDWNQLRNKHKPVHDSKTENTPTSYLFMCVSVWSKQCSPMRLFPERSRPPLPVYVNSSPRSYSRSQRQPTLHRVCSNSNQHWDHAADAPLRPQSPQPTPANKSHRCSARGSHQHEACERLLRSPEGTDPLNKRVTSAFKVKIKRKSHLNSEFPGGSNRNSRNGPVVV